MWFVVIAAVLVAAGLVIHSAKPAWYAKLWYPMNYSAAINREASATGLDPALIAALIWRESDFEPASESHRGAVGLTQVLPSTAREIAAAHNAPVGRAADLADPEVNIAFGAWYLFNRIGFDALYRFFPSFTITDETLAIAAGTSFGVGLASGVFPAVLSARMKVIDALARFG